MIDIESTARAILEMPHFGKCRATATIDVGNWTAEQVRELFDSLLAKQEEYKVKLKGVRADTVSFAKLGIEQETSNSGMYSGVPVVLTLKVDFDIMEFVFTPTQG